MYKIEQLEWEKIRAGIYKSIALSGVLIFNIQYSEGKWHASVHGYNTIRDMRWKHNSLESAQNTCQNEFESIMEQGLEKV